MVHVIPLSIAQRRLDTGNAVQYSNGSPIAAVIQGFGDRLSAVAERYQQMKDQQEAFDAELARRRFNGRVAQAEDEVAANAPADGAGLHETMYGQVDPRTGLVVKTGLFDTLFDEALANMPASQRAAFATQREPTRTVGARRMGIRQRDRRNDYEMAQVDTVLQTNAIAIAQGDPDDSAAFEAKLQDGLDLIAKMGADSQTKLQAMTDWFGATAKARVQALIAKDPKRAAELLGAAQAGASAGRVVEAASSAGSAATADKSADASDDVPAGNVSSVQLSAPNGQVAVPPEDSQEAFQQVPGFAPANGSGAATSKGDRVQNDNSAPADRAAVLAAAPWIADLSPNAMQDLGLQAQAVTTAQIFDARTNVQLAYQNAPADLMYTGNYFGKTPSDQDFTTVFGTEEGRNQSENLRRTFDVGRQAFEMARMPKGAIEAKVLEAMPKPGSATPEQDHSQSVITAAAAKQVLEARAAAPADFARKIDPAADASWNAISSEDSYDPAAYQKAIARSVAVQQQLGIKNIQPLPQSVVKYLVDTLNDENVPQRERDSILRDLFAGTSDPGVQAAIALQLADENQSRIARSIAGNSIPVSAEERVNRNLAAFDALPASLKPLVALNDIVRLMADGATLGYADKFAAHMNSLISGSNYEEELAAERAGTQNARDRSGSAGAAAEALGAYLTGRGLGEAGITLSGRFGTATMKGLSGLLARTGLMGVEGATYGAVEATGRDEPIGSRVVSGALWGAGNQFLKEASPAIHELPGWLEARSRPLRRKWEVHYKKDWPIDPDTGWNMDLHHKRARSEGGTDDVWNFEPLSRADHIKHHKERGDYKRWGRLGGGKRGSKQ
ncbi:HNH endonuclease signature motif containing protein [Mesorhizobium sp.]|uniref:HNH endonuclease signature motif containing protein n=1 Tax=Mesorhizobium sp. TaxID=1871066 RepID=UPI003BACC264